MDDSDVKAIGYGKALNRACFDKYQGTCFKFGEIPPPRSLNEFMGLPSKRRRKLNYTHAFNNPDRNIEEVVFLLKSDLPVTFNPKWNDFEGIDKKIYSFEEMLEMGWFKEFVK